ncbi:type II toxin-antitoxin system antitoxin DNA ADP-ribosyl glycohydrolase DarG [Marinobacter salarius]|uniref:RNase III inhibitor n=1 Tax=Marinobacter salarius TaxID=1420917 RepID=A0A1W6K696_9GAMM|nr:macro domain-containing protein [Marinobacter salarius]ARM82921.1 RNase III inhibitor [Marinobacter salarius]
MIEYTKGNLLEADVDALVNTVNTVGVMGKGIALMFKEAFPDNYRAYAEACKNKQVQTGQMFVTERNDLMGPRWIINFPTKQHWRTKTKLEWIDSGLQDLRKVIAAKGIQSIAIPPLGSGNGGLDWKTVKPRIEEALGNLTDVRVVLFEPTAQYQNVTRRKGVEKLTPPRAFIAELVRRYWMLGIECSLLEIQKLAWFMERAILKAGLEDPMDLRFEANRYGPYADRLRHLLDSLDGSYLCCEKRLGDAKPEDVIWFEQSRKEKVQLYLKSNEASPYEPALEHVSGLIDGFQSPLGMELLATVDWLIEREDCKSDLASIKEGLQKWPAGKAAAERKLKLFDDSMLNLAIERLCSF